jgi:hypothetical protein
MGLGLAKLNHHGSGVGGCKAKPQARQGLAAIEGGGLVFSRFSGNPVSAHLKFLAELVENRADTMAVRC